MKHPVKSLIRRLFIAATVVGVTCSVASVARAESAKPASTEIKLQATEGVIASTCEVIFEAGADTSARCQRAVRFLSERFGEALVAEMRDARNGASWIALMTLSLERAKP
jgi:hypothetical protein